MPDFTGLSTWANIVSFVAASAVVWVAGTELSVCAKQISERTRIGQALLGAMLLGGVVSLPELAMSLTASARGDAQLSIMTLLGGIPLTMAMVAITDACVGGRPISSAVSHPVVLLQGVLCIILLTLTAGAIVVGDVRLLAAGGCSLALLVLYVLMLILTRREELRQPWVARDKPADDEHRPYQESRMTPRSMPRILALTLAAAAVTVVAGSVLALSGEALGQQTGIGSCLVGMVLGGVATTLPELSTIYAAVRLRQYEMAFGDAFGTNLFSLMLIYFADLVYDGRPILSELDTVAVVAALLGIVTTTAYLAGLIRRSRFTVLRRQSLCDSLLRPRADIL